MTDIQALERYQYVLDNVLFIQDLLDADIIQIQGTIESVKISTIILLLTQDENLQDNSQYHLIESLKVAFGVAENEEYQEAQRNIPLPKKHLMIRGFLESAYQMAPHSDMATLEKFYQINKSMLEEKSAMKEVIK